MISPHNLLCAGCYRLFGQVNKPYNGKCEHDFCEKCAEKCKNEGKCSKCEKEDSFASAVVNYSALALIDDVKRQMFMNYEDVWSAEEVEFKPPCPICHQTCNKRRICVDCGLKEGFLVSGKEKPEDVFLKSQAFLRDGHWCPEQSGKFQKVVFCANCLLDEKTEHTNHKVVPIEQLSGDPQFQMRKVSRYKILMMLKYAINDVLRTSGSRIESEDQQRIRGLWDRLRASMELLASTEEVGNPQPTFVKDRHELIHALGMYLRRMWNE